MQKEQLSALMDGETLDNELLTELTRSAELQETWESYHLIRDSLRGDTSEVLHFDISSRVMAAIENEPVRQPTAPLIPEAQPAPHQWQKMPFWKKLRPWASQLTQMGVAACVSLAVIVGVQQYQVKPGRVLRRAGQRKQAKSRDQAGAKKQRACATAKTLQQSGHGIPLIVAVFLPGACVALPVPQPAATLCPRLCPHLCKCLSGVNNAGLSGQACAHFLRAHNLGKYLPKGRHVGCLHLSGFHCLAVVREVARCTGIVRQMTGKSKIKGGAGGGIHAHMGHHACQRDIGDAAHLQQVEQGRFAE